MRTRFPHFTQMLALVLLTVVAAAAHAGSYTIFNDDRAGFDAAIAGRGNATVIDSGGSFAADPTVGTVASVTRSGTVGGAAFSYTAYDLQFSATPTGTITPGVVGGDTGALSSIRIESPASQSGGVGVGSWGVDSIAVSTSRRSGLLVDFTTSPGGGISHFGVDLIDFEAGVGSEGQLRLYAAGLLVFTSDFALAPDGGDSSTHFLGVITDPGGGGLMFDQAVVLVGSKTDRWAADRFTFGSGGGGGLGGGAVARTPEPGTWALFALGLVGLTFHLRRKRTVEIDRRIVVR